MNRFAIFDRMRFKPPDNDKGVYDLAKIGPASIFTAKMTKYTSPLNFYRVKNIPRLAGVEVGWIG